MADGGSRLLLYLQYGYYGRERVVRGRAGQAGLSGTLSSVLDALCDGTHHGCQMRHAAVIGKLRVGIWRLAVEQCVPFILPPLQPPLMVFIIERSKALFANGTDLTTPAAPSAGDDGLPARDGSGMPLGACTIEFVSMPWIGRRGSQSGLCTAK